MMSDVSETIQRFEWLASAEGQQACQAYDQQADTALPIHQRLRQLEKQGWQDWQARAFVEQLELRQRAEVKFEQAAQMLFERTLLEQATDQRLAYYKAKRFAKAEKIVDYCCGLGGDLLALSQTADALAVDRNPVSVCLARHNCSVYGTQPSVLCQEVSRDEFDANRWFHIDPDRRAQSRRTTQLASFSPNQEALEGMIEVHQHGAIKLAPATEVPQHWQARCEREWIGDHRECRQQVLWFGETAAHQHIRSATVLDAKGDLVARVVENPDNMERDQYAKSVAEQVQAYLFEPHATVIAARLVDVLAEQLQVRRIHSEIAYLTSDEDCSHPALQRFRVEDVLKLDTKKLRRYFKERKIGRLEIKNRGVRPEIMAPLRNLKLTGDEQATLLVTRSAAGYIAIVAQRCR